MAMKERHPAWFKMFWHQRALIDSLPDAKVGQALKAAYQYFEDGTVPKMTPLAFTLFSSIKPYVDESLADFEAISKLNSEKAKRRWTKHSDAADADGIRLLPQDAEHAEAEAEADTPNGVDASGEERNGTLGDAALVGGPPARFYYDPVQDRAIDREEAWH